MSTETALSSMSFGADGALVALSSSTYGVWVERGPYPVIAEPRVGVVQAAQSMTSVRQGGSLAADNLAIDVLIIGDDSDDLLTRCENLAYLMDPTNGDKKIAVDNRAGRQWTGRLMSKIAPPKLGASLLRTQLVFAVNPTSEATSDTSQEVIVNETPESFTVPAAGNVAGVYRAQPVWTIEVEGGSSSSVWTLANTTTSQTVSVTKTVASGSFLRFDTARQIVEYSTDETTWTSVMSTLSTTNKTFPELVPRDSNECSLTATSSDVTDATLTITYRSQY